MSRNTAGTKASRKTYECTNCHTRVTMSKNDRLPKCPNCSNDEYLED